MNSKGSKENRIADETIMNRIYVLRGTKVMIDEDLAMLYHVKLEKIRSLLSSNARRFPKGFFFILSKDDYHSLCCQDRSVHRPEVLEEFPIALTEKGVLTLAGLVEGSRSVAVNARIRRIFTLIRQVLPD